jgi:hypothetical protein
MAAITESIRIFLGVKVNLVKISSLFDVLYDVELEKAKVLSDVDLFNGKVLADVELFAS